MVVTNGQKTTIHTLKQRLGIDNEDYRNDLESNYGVRSCTALSYQQAEEYIGHLRRMAGASSPPKRSKRYDDLGERTGMASPAQLRMIEAMWKDVSRYTDREARDRALCSWLFKRFKRSRPEMIEQRLVRKIVKALEAMKEQKQQPITQVSSNDEND